MRILAWLILGLAALLVGIALVADVVITNRVNKDPLRSQIDALVDEALGRDADWEKLGVGLFPPSLVIHGATLAGEGEAASAFVEAAKIELRVLLVPLLARAVVVDSLFIENAVVRLILTKDGLELPDFGRAEGDEAEGAEAEDEDDGGGGEETSSPPSVAIRRVELADARLVFSDRTVSPARGFELVDIDLRLVGTSLSEPFTVDATIAPEGEGLAAVRGTVGLTGELDLTVELKDFPLLPLDPYLAAADELKGRVSGPIVIQGPAAAPTKLSGELEVADARLRFQDTVIEGPLTWRLEHSGPWAAPRGSFHIDATRARANLAGVYEKAPGRPASITGKLVTKDGVIGFDDVELKIENADAQGQVEFGERLHARFRVDPIDLAFWQPLLKPLQDFELSGRISTGGWEIWNAPFAMKGRLDMDAVQVSGPKGREFVVNGSVIGGDGVIRTEEVVFDLAGQHLPVEAEFTELDGDWRYRVRAVGEQMDSNLLMARLVGRPDTLSGPLDLDADLNGTLLGESGFLKALRGRTRFKIAPGELKGISILEATLKQFDQIRGGGLLRGLLMQGQGLAPRMERYYQDDFIVLSATLDLNRGIASTPNLRMLTEGYEFTMQGDIDLKDLGLDARGEIKLGTELMDSIAKSVGLEELPMMQPIVIPIPRLLGTVTDPKPEPDFTYLVRALTTNIPGVRGMQQLLEGLDGVLQQPTRRP